MYLLIRFWILCRSSENDNSTAKIIVGGPYISNQKKEDFITTNRLYKYLGADIYVTCQEGEFTLANILSTLKANRSLDAVCNIAYKKAPAMSLHRARLNLIRSKENMVDYSLFRKEEIGEFVSLRTAKSCLILLRLLGFPRGPENTSTSTSGLWSRSSTPSGK